MADLYKEFSNLWNEYVNDMTYVVFDEYSGDFEDIDEVIGSRQLQDAIENDLYDNGFSTDEAQLLAVENGVQTKETLYKVLAYLLSLFGDWTNIEELKKLIEERSITDIENYTEEDLEKINKAYIKLS